MIKIMKIKKSSNKLQRFGIQEFLVLMGLIVFAIIIIYPLFWMIISSMKSYGEIYNDVWGFPSEWIFENYSEAWSRGVSNYFFNSVIVTIVTVIAVLIVGSMAAFALSRFK